MSRSTKIALGLGVLVLAATAAASPIGSIGPSGVQRAHPGDGALDAPVPDVGELGGPSRILTAAELDQWKRGRALFDHDFMLSEGCGAPDMNADSCRACHQDPVIGGAGPLELNVSRFGYDNGGTGPFVDLTGGQGLSKLRPPVVLPGVDAREEYETTGLEMADVFEQRQTPALFGGGLIDSISDATILANADPDDLITPDGITGTARRIDTGTDLEVGRFGWKAQIPRVKDFVRDAMAGECGITTPDDESRGFGMRTDGDAVSDPELTQSDIDDLVFFLSNLARPPSGTISDATRTQGEALFTSLGCAKCHIPTLQGSDGPVPLYSDLLLHNVMPASYRGMSELGAGVGWFRTPPLWGNCHSAPYMHDGRAETVHDAIMAHFGEAETIRQAYEALTQPEKDALLLFLSDI